MGDRAVFQPLTRKDTIAVILYRFGIVLSAVTIAGMAILLATAPPRGLNSPLADILLYVLYASVGMSVFFIHLYIGKLKVYLKYLYFISLGFLVVLLFVGRGSLSGALVQAPYSTLLLLPLSGCLGFVAAKEAFCFKLVEGYFLAMIMPLYLLLVSGTILAGRGAIFGLVLIAALFVLFTLRKTFMPLAYDIGDKSAYH